VVFIACFIVLQVLLGIALVLSCLIFVYGMSLPWHVEHATMATHTHIDK